MGVEDQGEGGDSEDEAHGNTMGDMREMELEGTCMNFAQEVARDMDEGWFEKRW